MLASVDGSHIEMAFDDGLAAVLSADSEITNAIESLINTAMRVSDEYYQIFETISGKDGNKIGSRFPSVRSKEGASGSILEVRWLRSVQGPEGRIRSTYLKGKSHQYNINKITRNAPDWEKALVEDTELQFAKIRTAYSALMKVRFYLRSAKKHLQVSDEIE